MSKADVPGGTAPGETAAPLTVIFTFLSRAEPSISASGSDPNLDIETWGDYWRKVHGVRFLHPETTADEGTIARLLRYDQIHRIAPGPTSSNPPPYRPPLDTEGRLFDTIVGHVGPYKRPKWDGVAYLTFASLDDVGTVLGAERVQTKIMPEDHAIFRDLAPMLARQFVILPNSAANDSVTLVTSHVRGSELDRATFQQRWLGEHAAFVARQPAVRQLVRRYVQLHNTGPTTEGKPFYHAATARIDGVTLMSFASVRDVETFLLSKDHAAIRRSEAKLADPEVQEFWTGLTLTVVDQLAPEMATEH